MVSIGENLPLEGRKLDHLASKRIRVNPGRFWTQSYCPGLSRHQGRWHGKSKWTGLCKALFWYTGLWGRIERANFKVCSMKSSKIEGISAHIGILFSTAHATDRGCKSCTFCSVLQGRWIRFEPGGSGISRLQGSWVYRCAILKASRPCSSAILIAYKILEVEPMLPFRTSKGLSRNGEKYHPDKFAAHGWSVSKRCWRKIPKVQAAFTNNCKRKKGF